jgi:hypothetical protein
MNHTGWQCLRSIDRCRPQEFGSQGYGDMHGATLGDGVLRIEFFVNTVTAMGVLPAESRGGLYCQYTTPTIEACINA